MSNKRYEVNTPGVSPVDRDITKLLYVSTAKYGGDWHSLMHTHACTELFYVVGGMGQFKVAEKLIPVSPDDLVIVNPNVEHTEVSLNASPLEYIVLGVEGMEFAADENGEAVQRIQLPQRTRGYSALSAGHAAGDRAEIRRLRSRLPGSSGGSGR